MNIKIFSGWVEGEKSIKLTPSIMKLDEIRSNYFKDLHYELITDKFFQFIPNWENLISPKCKLGTLSDLARLQWIEYYLDNGYDCCGWVDADILPIDLNIDFDNDIITSDINDSRLNNSIIIFRNTIESRKLLKNYIDYILLNLHSNTCWFQFGPDYLNKIVDLNSSKLFIVTNGLNYNIKLKNYQEVVSTNPSFINFSCTYNYTLFNNVVNSIISEII